ncbi:hypothetical protein CW712_02495 [Candidatus Bathyarchaeota archaeon]|nr:MAG: hypothetical protein CW712_02495 [Candidatus Bathyarchaeota archaeon]
MGDLTEEASAVIHVGFRSEKIAETIQKALDPETRSPATYRCKVQVKRTGRMLTLIFDARDTTALRASVNSYLSWLRLLKDVCERVKARMP